MTRPRSLSSLAIALVSLATPALVWLSTPTAVTGPEVSSPPPAARAATQIPTTSSKDRDTVLLFGDLRRPQLLSTRKLASYPQQTVTATFSARGVPTTRTYTGPLLLDVVASAEPRFDSARSNDQLAFAIRVGATDGYRAVLAYGEIDPNFANTPVLLALTENGEPLQRPRLVVPGDARGGRYVTDVNSVGVIDLGR